jgi:hypothetical protein
VGPRKKGTHVRDFFIAFPSHVLDQDSAALLGFFTGDADCVVIVSRDDGQMSAFVGDETHRVWMHSGRYKDLDSELEKASDSSNSAPVVAGGGSVQCYGVEFGGFFDLSEFTIKRQFELPRDGAKCAPGSAKDLGGWYADAVAFLFEIHGIDAELFRQAI